MSISKSELLSKILVSHGDLYEYSDLLDNYNSTHTKITIICKIHGEFNQKIANHIRGQTCPKCNKNGRKTLSEFITNANITHSNFYDYSLITNETYKNKKVSIICPNHGTFEQLKSNHVFGQGCPKCARIKAVATTKETFQNKYNVSHHMHLSEFVNAQSKYCRKEFIFPNSDKVYYLQGYEPLALIQLISEGYIESDFDFDNIPSLKYFWPKDKAGDDKFHVYHPDFYVPSENLIIEVKSGYTLDGNGKRKDWGYRNKLKEEACLLFGYNFRLMVL